MKLGMFFFFDVLVAVPSSDPEKGMKQRFEQLYGVSNILCTDKFF